MPSVWGRRGYQRHLQTRTSSTECCAGLTEDFRTQSTRTDRGRPGHQRGKRFRRKRTCSKASPKAPAPDHDKARHDVSLQRHRPGPYRTRFARRGAGPGRPPVGGPDAALLDLLPDRHRPLSLGPPGHPGARHPEEMRGRRQRHARPVAGRQGRPHRGGRPGGDRRTLGRRVPAGGVPDGIGHPDQHERQRGDRQSRDPPCRRPTRLQDADQPERRRQPRSIVERRLSDRHAHRHRGGDRGPPHPGHHEPARHVRRQGRQGCET